MFPVLIVLFLTLLYIKLSKTYSYWTDRGVRQRRQIFLLGDTGRVLLRRESVYDVMTDLYNSFPDERYVGLYHGLFPILMLKDPKLIRDITTNDFDHFTDHQMIAPDSMDPIWTKNLLALKGDEWRRMRALLSASFRSGKMETFFDLVSETAGIYLEYLKNGDHSESVELNDLFTRYANDVIATVAFGIKCDSINDKTNEFYRMGKETVTFDLRRHLILFCLIVLPKINKMFKLNLFPSHITNFFKRIINDTIKIREEQNIVRPDMIHLLLEARRDGFPLTDTDIISHAVIFFFGGYENVSNLMSFMGYELAINQEMQETLQREIDDTVKQCEGGILTYEALSKMKYMDMIVMESLRKWPPILVDRQCTKFYKIPTGSAKKEILIQPDDLVWIPISAIHRDPRYYPNPERFDPERFNEKNRENIKPCTYLPFGVGPRSCVGYRLALLEAKVVFFYLLRHFSFVSTEKTEIPLKTTSNSISFLAKNGIWIGIRPRNTC